MCCFLASVFGFGFYVSVLIGWSRQVVVHCPVPFSVEGSPGSDVWLLSFSWVSVFLAQKDFTMLFRIWFKGFCGCHCLKAVFSCRDGVPPLPFVVPVFSWESPALLSEIGRGCSCFYGFVLLNWNIASARSPPPAPILETVLFAPECLERELFSPTLVVWSSPSHCLQES